MNSDFLKEWNRLQVQHHSSCAEAVERDQKDAQRCVAPATSPVHEWCNL